MSAPKGNKNATKPNPKAARFGVRIHPDTRWKLEKIVEKEDSSISQVIEKLIIKKYFEILEK